MPYFKKAPMTCVRGVGSANKLWHGTIFIDIVQLFVSFSVNNNKADHLAKEGAYRLDKNN